MGEWEAKTQDRSVGYVPGAGSRRIWGERQQGERDWTLFCQKFTETGKAGGSEFECSIMKPKAFRLWLTMTLKCF